MNQKNSKLFFVLGRNPELSREEILSFLTARNQPAKEISFRDNILILETQKEPNIQELGGTIKIGKIEFEGNENQLEGYVDSREIADRDKFTYATFGNYETDILRDKFKQMRKKAMLKHGRKQLKDQKGKTFGIPNVDFEFLIEESRKIFFGRVTQSYDSYEVAKRDMKKPERREALAISPRLSKILINLAEAKENNLLLDPFCGVGCILQEALVKNIEVYGIDKDPKAITGAKRNLTWLRKNYNLNKKYTLENKDSRNTPDKQFDAIATETPLGELVRKKVSAKEAKRIISNFEAIITPILKRLNQVKKPNAKISITFPKIRETAVDANTVAKQANLRIVKGPFHEFRPGQFITREIYVFS